MKNYKIKSHAKLNLSLNVIKKVSKNFHKIESLITFINLHDLIYIKEIKNSKHKIKFHETDKTWSKLFQENGLGNQQGNRNFSTVANVSMIVLFRTDMNRNCRQF